MSQRLTELQRQRAVLQGHLAWLDREIAVEVARGSTTEGAVVTPAASVPPRGSGAATTRVTSLTPADNTLADSADETFETSVNLAPPLAVSTTPAPSAPADVILSQYRVPADALQKDVRKGCFLYFGLAFVLLGIGVAALYVLFQH